MQTHLAEPVITDTVEAATAVFGTELSALFTMGSLAHGGFAPEVSDVDIAIILTATGADSAARIAEVQSRVEARATSPLSARLSLFWADWLGVRTGEGEYLRLGPIDRLDLLDWGHLLLGSDEREPSVRPGAGELVLMSADHIIRRFDDRELARLSDVRGLVGAGPRAVTKAVLFPVRFMFTLATGQVGLNDAAAHWYAEAERPGGELALMALDWRQAGIAEPELAQQMLEADLGALHAECFTAYAHELDQAGDLPRAAALAECAARVHLLTSDVR